VPTKVEALLTKWKSKPATPSITVDPKDGSIIIPAAAFASKNRSAGVTVRPMRHRRLPAVFANDPPPPPTHTVVLRRRARHSAAAASEAQPHGASMLCCTSQVMQSADAGSQILHGGCRSSVVSAPLPSFARAVLTETSLCHVCSCYEISRAETARQGPPCAEPLSSAFEYDVTV
jgi:hypothetical protein